MWGRDCVDEERMEEGCRVGLELEDLILDDREDEEVGEVGDLDVGDGRKVSRECSVSGMGADEDLLNVLAVMGASKRVTISGTCVRSNSCMAASSC
jgi:hypothetical protein